jgi:ectoine hydroxylase-related dioxygenase (phytanoyl-CoA dioxygenase family)
MPAMLRRRAEHLLPYTELGTVLLMDYRLLHAGTENRSSRVRPILYNEYCRPWFRDSRNYFKQEPLRMSRAIYERVPDDLKSLFAHLYPQRSEPASVENGAAR